MADQAEDAFLCAKHAVTLLHAKMVDLRAKATSENLSDTLKLKISRSIAAYLSLLESLHNAVRGFLRQLGDDQCARTATNTLLQKLTDLSDEVAGLEAVEAGRPAELAAQVRQLRATKLEDDVRAAREIAAGLPQGTPVQANALEAVIRHLSAREQSLAFHVRLAAEVEERFGSLGGRVDSGSIGGGNAVVPDVQGAPPGTDRPPLYTVDNFVYGSTPYTSWLQVLQQVGGPLQDAMASPGRESVVWGSSCGWLVLYGALTYGWRSRGVEILSYLHECAQEVAEGQAGALAGTAGVCFTRGDLLEDDVTAAGLVIMADQCWDEQLAAAATAKLARELPAGALCVSYRGAALAAVGRFEEVAAVRAPVSWNEGQLFRVFRRL